MVLDQEKEKKLLNLIKEQDKRDVIDKMYFYAWDLNEPNYEYLIKNHENIGIKHLSYPNALII